MIYIIDGTEPYYIKEKLNEIIPYKEDDLSLFSFNGTDKEFDVKEVVNACNSTSLFALRNYVVVLNPPFLISKGKEKKNDDDLKVLLDYCAKPLYDTDLIFYTYENNFSKVLKAYKAISANAEVITLNSLDAYNFKNRARSIIKDKKLNITDEAISKLVNLVDCSMSSFMANLQILEDYGQRIDEKAIEKLCTGEITNDIFDFINALSRNDLSKAIIILHNLYQNNNSAFYIISVLAGQLRFLYQVSYYKSLKMNNREISQIIKTSEYRIEMSLRTLSQLNREKIMYLLSELSKLDLLNKSDSSLTAEERFELFVVKNFRSQYESN